MLAVRLLELFGNIVVLLFDQPPQLLQVLAARLELLVVREVAFDAVDLGAFHITAQAEYQLG